MKRIAIRMGDGWRRHADPRWLDGWAPRPFELRGGTTELVEMGSGPPLLMIPPLPGFKEAFVACAQPLARSFRVVTFDLRTTYLGDEPWAELLGDLDDIADALGLRRFALAGHSLGGAIAQRWAAARPERAAALVLSSAFARVTTPRGARTARFLEQPLVVAAQRLAPRPAALAVARRLARRNGWIYDANCDDAVLDLVRHAIRDCPIGAGIERIRLAFSHDFRDRLAVIAAPTLLLVGEHDTAFARAATEEIRRLIPNAERRVSPGVGHLHPLSGAAWFADTIAAWVRAHLV
jgi:pimeloyl-ACP methyl ester carboxylesterase